LGFITHEQRTGHDLAEHTVHVLIAELGTGPAHHDHIAALVHHPHPNKIAGDLSAAQQLHRRPGMAVAQVDRRDRGRREDLPGVDAEPSVHQQVGDLVPRTRGRVGD
jgi:hypothetical protein